MVHLPLALWTHVWISLHANQTLHPEQGGLTDTPCHWNTVFSCLFPAQWLFFFMAGGSFKRKTQTVERTPVEIKIHLIWQHWQSCTYVTGDLWQPGRKKCGGSSSGHNHRITSDLSFQLQLPCSEVSPTSPPPDDFTSVAFIFVNMWSLQHICLLWFADVGLFCVRSAHPGCQTPPETHIVQQWTWKYSHVVICFPCFYTFDLSRVPTFNQTALFNSIAPFFSAHFVWL